MAPFLACNSFAQKLLYMKSIANMFGPMLLRGRLKLKELVVDAFPHLELLYFIHAWTRRDIMATDLPVLGQAELRDLCFTTRSEECLPVPAIRNTPQDNTVTKQKHILRLFRDLPTPRSTTK